jgi:hypothetical protein
MPPRQQQPQLAIHVDADQMLPELEGTWINRFKVPSSSSSGHYVVSQNITKRHWACSCRGYTTHRRCKHLTQYNLPANETPCEVTMVINCKDAVSVPPLHVTRPPGYVAPATQFIGRAERLETPPMRTDYNRVVTYGSETGMVPPQQQPGGHTGVYAPQGVIEGSVEVPAGSWFGRTMQQQREDLERQEERERQAQVTARQTALAQAQEAARNIWRDEQARCVHIRTRYGESAASFIARMSQEYSFLAPETNGRPQPQPPAPPAQPAKPEQPKKRFRAIEFDDDDV